VTRSGVTARSLPQVLVRSPPAPLRTATAPSPTNTEDPQLIAYLMVAALALAILVPQVMAS
jgi:hypothetical protein